MTQNAELPLSHLISAAEITRSNDRESRPYCARKGYVTIRIPRREPKRAELAELLGDRSCFADCSEQLASALVQDGRFIEVEMTDDVGITNLHEQGFAFGRSMVMFSAALGEPAFAHPATSAHPATYALSLIHI